jgi:hypothetical protein
MTVPFAPYMGIFNRITVSAGIKPSGIIFPGQINNIILYSFKRTVNYVGVGNF